MNDPAELRSLIVSILAQSARPLPMRHLEAHVVLRGMDVFTYDVQRAIRELVEDGAIIEGDDFGYSVGTTAPPVAPTLDPLDLASVKAWVEHPDVCLHSQSRAVLGALAAEVERLRNRPAIQQFVDDAIATRRTYLEILGAAFAAKCDSLDPRECELVEERTGTEIRWHFRKRTP